MKKAIALLIGALFLSPCFAQNNIGVGTTSPHASAKVDVQSTTQGMLVPRMKNTQRLAIPSPANGLLVFDTTTNSFWFHNGTKWVELVGNDRGMRDTDGDTRVEVERFADEDRVRITAGNADVARFGANDIFLNGRTSIGTPTKRGLLTIRGADDIEFGPTLFMYGNGSDQTQSGRIRFSEGTATTNWRGGYLHYDGNFNRMHLGVHNNADKLASSDFNALSILRGNGFVGINNQSPLHRLSVNGTFKADDGAGINVETNGTQIILKAGQTEVIINENGKIKIATSNQDIDLTSMSGDINLASTTGNINLSGLNVNINSTVQTKINGIQVLINSANNAQPAARVGDTVGVNGSAGTIATGSTSVFIGN